VNHVATEASSEASKREDGSTLVLPLVREELAVGVEQVDTGRGVRIHKGVTEQAHPVAHTLRRDSVDVKRVPVDRIVPPSEVPGTRQEGNVTIIPVLEEVLVVEKRVRIKEELHITRTVHEHTVSDQVVLRSEDVTIERFDQQPDSTANPTEGGTHHATHTRSRV
jgi:stress response protein YsnF